MDYISKARHANDNEIARFRIGYNVFLILYPWEPS
jgi:hypothetical protein